MKNYSVAWQRKICFQNLKVFPVYTWVTRVDPSHIRALRNFLGYLYLDQSESATIDRVSRRLR